MEEQVKDLQTKLQKAEDEKAKAIAEATKAKSELVQLQEEAVNNSFKGGKEPTSVREVISLFTEDFK